MTHPWLRATALSRDLEDEEPDYFYWEEDDVYHVALHEPGTAASLPEAFVQDIWERQNFDHSDLVTVQGERVTVVDPGRRNDDSGPDFSGASLRIGEVEWVGDVEIHVYSGNWNDHRHVQDRSYNSVILHVALYADVWTGTLLRADGSVMPEIVLFPRLKDSVRRLIHDFHRRDSGAILCAPQWPQVPESLVQTWITELAAMRLDERARRVRVSSEFGFNAEQHLYERTFAALGYAKNAAPMKELARRLPLTFLSRQIPPEDLEACFLGVAGLLPHPSDLLEADRSTADYAMALRDRYERLQLRHSLAQMPREVWKFFRLRPNNFPPRRIAQGVALLREGGPLRSRAVQRLREACLSPDPLRNLRKCFRIEMPAFWTHHVRLEKPSSVMATELGRQRIDVILVNAVLPVLARLADAQDDRRLRDAIRAVLEAIPPEKDEIVRLFTRLGTEPQCARDAQGMHELYARYCSRTRCLTCRIGQYLMGRTDESRR